MRTIANALIKLLVGAAAFLITLTAISAGESSRPFLHPDRIRYDSHCLTIDGKDVFLYSGVDHFFGRPMQTRINDVHTGIAQRPRDHLHAAVMAIKPDLGQ